MLLELCHEVHESGLWSSSFLIDCKLWIKLIEVLDPALFISVVESTDLLVVIICSSAKLS